MNPSVGLDRNRRSAGALRALASACLDDHQRARRTLP
jgi:hypothetical protein